MTWQDYWDGVREDGRKDAKNHSKVAYNITTLNSDIGGYRTVEQRYRNLSGGSQMLTQTINSSLWWNPIEDLVIAPSVQRKRQMNSGLAACASRNFNSGSLSASVQPSIRSV